MESVTTIGSSLWWLNIIGEIILSVFCHCKDIEFLTLVNLVDNYMPLVQSIHSIVFKSNDYTLKEKSLLRCWVMFMVFGRRYYDKALLVTQSAFMYCKKMTILCIIPQLKHWLQLMSTQWRISTPFSDLLLT